MAGAYYEQGIGADAENLHRAIVSLEEELEAVNAYNQRMAATEDAELRELLKHNRDEEVEHASMLIEWLRRRVPKFDEELGTYLFKEGSLLEAEAAGKEGESPAGDGSLGIGKLRG